MSLPTMHCHTELLNNLGYVGFLSDETLFKWSRGGYSTSRHLLTIYAIATGLKAQTIVEVGFGRTSFVLARVAAEFQGQFYTCDMRDFSYLLSTSEKKITCFLHGQSDIVWSHEMIRKAGIDFAFLDYFSGTHIGSDFIASEILNCLDLMKGNGIIAIHDAGDERFAVKEALTKIYSDHRIESLLLPYNYGLALIRRLPPTNYQAIGGDWLKKADV